MPHDRMMQAIGRIERALGRLETIKFPSSGDDQEMSALQDRYNRLREETRNAILAIDKLIEKTEV